jgi:glycosyltransferase involved in cell wall biosynthesis
LKRVLLVQPSLNPPGGGNAVAAWIVQALRESCEVSVLSWRPPRLEEINGFFGTSLEAQDFSSYLAPARMRRFLDAMPASLALLKGVVLRRELNRLRSIRDFDVLLGADNEFDFGCRGIQYLNYPNQRLPRPSVDYRWYHRIPGLVRAYRALSRRLANASVEAMRANLTLVNSAYIAKMVAEVHGIDPRIVFPPVPGRFPQVDWDQRKDGFLCVGRFAREKRLETVIEIVAGLRARGRKIVLHLVGDVPHSRYGKRIVELARQNDSWIQLHLSIPREQLVELMAQNRYGIHGMLGEHFGIAVAELQRAGCVVFAPNSGGPAEIIAGDLRTLYESPQDAISKIDAVLEDPQLRDDLRAAVARRRDCFSAERFASEIRQIVLDFEPDGSA